MKILKILLVGIFISTSSNTNLLNNSNEENNKIIKTNNLYSSNTTIDNLTNWYQNTSIDKTNIIKNYINNNEKVSVINTDDQNKTIYNFTDSFSDVDLTNFVNEKIISTEIKTTLLSTNYLKNLNQIINYSKIITVNKNYVINDNSLNYNGNSLNYDGDHDWQTTNNNLNSESPNGKYAWAICHWYWFGYWKLCIDHTLSQKLSSMILGKNPSQADIGATLEPYTYDCSPSGNNNAISAFLIISKWSRKSCLNWIFNFYTKYGLRNFRRNSN